MCKVFAGIFVLVVTYFFPYSGTVDIAVDLAILFIGAGLDTMIYKNR